MHSQIRALPCCPAFCEVNVPSTSTSVIVKFKQIKDLPDSYVVNDDVEIGMGNKIPLWLFGFLY
jgi:hypothetical protein